MLSKLKFPIQKTEQQWKAILSPEQFAILRQKKTERPGTGEYLYHKSEGVYHCAGCDSPLYKSASKFNSHCGWPAFFQAVPGAIELIDDYELSVKRTEMVCKQCGGHLGHLFRGEGFDTPTDERHCVNSISLKFRADEHLGEIKETKQN